MTKTLDNRQLTSNYTLYEFIEGQLPDTGKMMNWKNIAQMDIKGIEKAATHAQSIRDLINKNFKSDTGGKEIGLRITSGWRCKEWELHQGRSGNSQHVISAYDAQPVNCSMLQSSEIIGWLKKQFEADYKGGLATKLPSFSKGMMITAGFIHFDFRGTKARWTY
jgi:hypothetical protein